jgi:hypothetical protein
MSFVTSRRPRSGEIGGIDGVATGSGMIESHFIIGRFRPVRTTPEG